MLVLSRTCTTSIVQGNEGMHILGRCDYEQQQNAVRTLSTRCCYRRSVRTLTERAPEDAAGCTFTDDAVKVTTSSTMRDQRACKGQFTSEKVDTSSSPTFQLAPCQHHRASTVKRYTLWRTSSSRGGSIIVAAMLEL